MSINWTDIENALHAWVVAGSGLPEQKVVWTQQPDAPRPAEPAIMLKWYVADDIGRPWVDTVNNPFTFDDLTITAVSGDSLTAVGHEKLTGDGPVRFQSTIELPAPLAVGTDYWIIRIDDDTFRLAASFRDAGVGSNVEVPITLTSTGSGVITMSDTAETLRSGEEILHVVRGLVRIGLQLFCHTATGVDMNAAMAILRRVVDRAYLPSQQARLTAVNVSLSGFERIRPLYGDKDAVLFQPRAWVDAHLTTVVHEEEFGMIIERVTGNRNVPPDGPDVPFEIPKP